MKDLRTYYLGIHHNVLEPISLNFSTFGALWYEEDKQRYIVGYGFGSSQIEALYQFCKFSAYYTCTDEQVIYDIYRSIRDKQQEQDWQTRKRLAWKAVFSEPWRSMNDGWYVLRSRNRFPLHLSIVHKRKYSIWLEHAAVCENEAELLNYMDRAKQSHHLRTLTATAIQEDSVHE